jgi:hypothetical protein
MPKTTQSTQYAAQLAAAGNFTSRIDDARQIQGAVHYATIVVPLTTDNVANDVISLLKLPPGAIVLPELSRVLVTDDATSGALTLDIGDVVDPDRYADGINAASVGIIEFCSVLSGTVPAALKTRHKVDAAAATDLVTLTLATFGATIEAGELVVVLAYKTL